MFLELTAQFLEPERIRWVPVPTSEKGLRTKAPVTGVNEGGDLCSCALYPPEGAGAAASPTKVGGAVGEGAPRKDFGLGPASCPAPYAGRTVRSGPPLPSRRAQFRGQRQHNDL